MAHDTNIDFMQKLESSHEAFFDRMAKTSMSRQPGIYRFIIESLFEDMSEMFEVTEEEEGWIFLVLKTTVDVLIENVK